MEALTKAKVKDNICKLNNYKINKSHHLKMKSIKFLQNVVNSINI